MKKRVLEVAILSTLAAVPTAMGYVLGPLSRALNAATSTLGLPFAPRLGFIPLVTATVLARAIVGKGAALKEGVLLALLGAVFHPTDLTLRFLRDLMLGVGVEVATLSCKSFDASSCVIAGILGGFISYTPYLVFAPAASAAVALYAAIVLSTANWLVSCAIGGYLAYLSLKGFNSLHRPLGA